MTNHQSATPIRHWSITDPVWYGVVFSALIGAELIRRVLPGESSDFAHYAATFPLVAFLALTAYERFRLGARWQRAFTVGLAAGLVALGIGWLKGQL
jgi:cell shape-determining protein MreD